MILLQCDTPKLAADSTFCCMDDGLLQNFCRQRLMQKLIMIRAHDHELLKWQQHLPSMTCHISLTQWAVGHFACSSSAQHTYIPTWTLCLQAWPALDVQSAVISYNFSGYATFSALGLWVCPLTLCFKVINSSVRSISVDWVRASASCLLLASTIARRMEAQCQWNRPSLNVVYSCPKPYKRCPKP